MNLKKIRSLKKEFQKATTTDAKQRLALEAIHNAGHLMRSEVGWAINFDAANTIIENAKDYQKNRVSNIPQKEIDNAPDEIKRLILSRFLTSFAPNSLVMELGLALAGVVDGKQPSLLKSKGKHVGTIELWTYQAMGAAYIAYLVALGHKSEEAINMVSEAYKSDSRTVASWNRRTKRPPQINNELNDRYILSARAEGKKYKSLRMKNPKADSPNYGLERLKETGLQYQAINLRINKLRKDKKRGK